MNNPIITYRGRDYTHEELLERLETGEKLLYKMMEQYKKEVCSTSSFTLREEEFDDLVKRKLLPSFSEGMDFLTHNDISPTFNLY